MTVAGNAAVEDEATIKLKAALVREAEALGLPVEQLLNSELSRAIGTRKRELAWQDENAEAIGSFNEYIDKHGTIGDLARRYG
jgi:post-segregation antitoxin (ccd killing protein)